MPEYEFHCTVCGTDLVTPYREPAPLCCEQRMRRVYSVNVNRKFINQENR